MIVEDLIYEIKRNGGTTTPLKLAEKLVKDMTIDSFVVINENFPYNSVVVASYAIISKSYIILVDDSNVDAVYAFLSKNGKKVHHVSVVLK